MHIKKLLYWLFLIPAVSQARTAVWPCLQEKSVDGVEGTRGGLCSWPTSRQSVHGGKYTWISLTFCFFLLLTISCRFLFSVQGASGGWTCVLLISPLIKLSVSCVLWDRGSAVISEKAEAPPVSISGNVWTGQDKHEAQHFYSGIATKSVKNLKRKPDLFTPPPLKPTDSFNSRMDKDEGKPKTYLSTFHFVLKPRGQRCGDNQRENGRITANKSLAGSNKVGVSAAAGNSRFSNFCILSQNIIIFMHSNQIVANILSVVLECRKNWVTSE